MRCFSSRRATAWLCTVLMVFQPLGVGGCFVAPVPGLNLSDAALDPGRLLTIADSIFQAGAAHIVRFAGPDGMTIAVPVTIMESGVLRVAVPPIFSISAGDFTSANVTVTVDGLPGAQSFHINDLPDPGIGGSPGDVLRAFLQFQVDEHTAQLAAIDGFDALYGSTPDVVDSRNGLTALIDFNNDLLQQLDLFGDIEFTDEALGTQFAGAQELALADQLLAASLAGAMQEAEAAGFNVARKIHPAASITEDPYAFATNALKALKESAAPGVLAISAFLSGTLGFFAIHETLAATAALGGTAGTIAGVASGLGILVVAALGVHAAVMTFGSESAVSAMQGLEADAYRDGQAALQILKDTAVDIAKSIALIFAEVPLLDLLDGLKNYFDALTHWGNTACQDSQQEQRGKLVLAAAAPSAEFCAVVLGGSGAGLVGCGTDTAAYQITSYSNFDGQSSGAAPPVGDEYAALADVCISGPLTAPVIRWRTTTTGGAVQAYGVTLGYDEGDPWDYRASGEENASLFLSPPVIGGQADTPDTTVFGAFRMLESGRLYSIFVRGSTPESPTDTAFILFMVR